VTHADTARSRRRRRRRTTRKVKEILETGLIFTAITLVVGLLILSFNPERADRSRLPYPDGKALKP
jgi:hypothetical protein